MGDPFLTAYWLRNYETWRGEVDQLVIGLIDPGEEVQAHIAALAPDARIVTIHRRMPHGRVMELLLSETDADEILFVEDDAYVRHPGVVDAAFRALADVDVVGTLRGPDIIDGVEFSHLLPCFLFARRETLAGLDFGTANGSDGIHRDTFGMASFALRDKRLDVRKPYLIPYKVPARPQFESWITDDPPWFHVGGLSMGYGGWLGNDIGQEPYGEDLGWDLACRIAWWERCLAETDGLPGPRARYRAALDGLIDRQQVGRTEIAAWHAAFEPWVTW
jgi:hypothetical protein